MDRQEATNKALEMAGIDKSSLKEFGWEDLEQIDKFVIFEGAERIYEVHIKGKKVRLEGKEIMDYNIFRLRFFETFGIMLGTFRGIGAVWASLVTNWNEKYGYMSELKTEQISESQEARDMIIDYINNAAIADNYVIKEGVITMREDCLYIPTKIIKKILKRNNLIISMRKLAYLMDDYLLSGSVPLKIENRSERFWKFDMSKFNIDKTKVSIVEVENE